MLPYPEIDPVALALGPVKIHWYGLTYLAGIGFAWWLAIRRSRRPWSVVRREQIDDLIFYAALGVVFGGRLGYALFYGGEVPVVGSSPKDPTHSAIMGVKLAETLKEAGVDCTLVHTGVKEPKYKSSTEYLIDVLSK